MESLDDYLDTIDLPTSELDELMQLYLDNCRIDPNRIASGVDIFRNFDYL